MAHRLRRRSARRTAKVKDKLLLRKTIADLTKRPRWIHAPYLGLRDNYNLEGTPYSVTLDDPAAAFGWRVYKNKGRGIHRVMSVPFRDKENAMAMAERLAGFPLKSWSGTPWPSEHP